MRALLQRVKEARVTVEGEVVGAIGPGLLVFLGLGLGDTEARARALAEKTANLRIFEDEAGKMNRSVLEGSRAVLVVSQFTLHADTSRGRRPSFVSAMSPAEAQALYEVFCLSCEGQGLTCARGRFRAHMEVALVNDGPVTIWLDDEGR